MRSIRTATNNFGVYIYIIQVYFTGSNYNKKKKLEKKSFHYVMEDSKCKFMSVNFFIFYLIMLLHNPVVNGCSLEMYFNSGRIVIELRTLHFSSESRKLLQANPSLTQMA